MITPTRSSRVGYRYRSLSDFASRGKTVETTTHASTTTCVHPLLRIGTPLPTGTREAPGFWFHLGVRLQCLGRVTGACPSSIFGTHQITREVPGGHRHGLLTILKFRYQASDRDRVRWCAWNLRPESILRDVGFVRLAGRLNPYVVSRKLSAQKFNAYLLEESNSEKARVMNLLDDVSASFVDGMGPCFSGSFDGWTNAAIEACLTFSTSWTDVTFKRQRVMLAFREV